MSEPAAGEHPPTATGRPVAVVLQVAVADAQAPLRLPLQLNHALRVSLTARIGAAGGQVVNQEHGLTAFFSHPRHAIRATVSFMDNAAGILQGQNQTLAVRAVLVTPEKGHEADNVAHAQAAAAARAQRILQVSRDGTLLICRTLYEHLQSNLAERARLAIPPALADHHPGFADVFDLDWAGAAQLAPSVTGTPLGDVPSEADGWIELTHGGTHLKVAAQDCPLLVGRDRSCQLHLGGDVASRVHGRIEYQHEKFYFVDDSRNGTYLLTPQGEEVFLHRERLPLLGRGVISPGAPIVKQTGEVVRYTCHSQGEPAALVAAA